MTNARALDKEMLMKLDKEQLAELMLIHTRNLWTVDGLYYLGIEQAHGMEEATRIDANVWRVMGKIEGRRLKAFLGHSGDVELETAIEIFKLSVWSMDLENKEFDWDGKEFRMRNVNCRVQNARLSKGLDEFGCKVVRFDFLKTFFHELNPKIKVDCEFCPPDAHPDDHWCEWVMSMEED